MAPALTATVDNTRHAVTLTVTGALGAITVTRYVPGASPTGTLVRGSFANGRAVADTDAPLNTDLTYIANDAGPPPTQSTQKPARIAATRASLSVMNSPALWMDVTVLADDQQFYLGASTARKILGTNTPLVTVEPPPYRAGVYRLLLPTVTDWLSLRQIIMTGGVLLLRSPCQSEYLDTAFIMVSGRQNIAWNSAPPRTRVFELEYQATAPDSTPAQDIAWTYADIPASFATYDAIPLALSTYNDLLAFIPAPAGLAAPVGF